MKNDTRRAFDLYCATIANLNQVSLSALASKFAVSPTVQQTLENRIQESSQFLKSINNIAVSEQMGNKIGLGIGSTVASTVDTTQNDRTPFDPTEMDEQGYVCSQTNFDTAIRYAKLDAWAKFPDFQARVRSMILQRQALDIITIGFNGTSRAANSDRNANPLLQDVNIGWLEKIRQFAPQRHLAEVEANSGKILVGSSATNAKGYKNLDALVVDAVNNLIDPWHREDTDLVVVVGRELMHDKYFPLINSNQAPTERIAANMLISQNRVGNQQAVRVANFPANAMMVTRLDNLSRYYQEGGRRRSVIDNPKRDQIENYESSNDAYVVEDYGMVALVENIEMVD